MFDAIINWFKSLGSKETAVTKSASNLIKYVLNDPTTPSLIMEMAPPAPPAGMPFSVYGYAGGGYEPNTVQGQAANDYVTLAESIKLIQSYSSKPLTKWAATRKLMVVPRAGKDLNAYYDRSGLKFFYMPDRKLGKTVFAADSADVVAHELGHAILDALRPDLWSLQALETWAFHEAYGDINAILSILVHEPVIQYVLKQTDNNLRKDNVVAGLAEELGIALYDLGGSTKRGALRNAINSFVYTAPEKLPQDGPDEELSGEPHNFGRLFLGAWYELFVSIYELEAKNANPVDAVKKARDVAGTYLWGGIAQAPATTRFYNAVAQGMISFSKMKGRSDYGDIIQSVFQNRKILQTRPVMAASVEDIKFSKGDELVHGTNNRKVIIKKNVEVVKLNEHLGLSVQSENPLYNLDIEIPRDVAYEFNSQGRMVGMVADSRDQAINGARVCLNYLHAKGLVGDEPKKPFKVENNKLVRSKFID